MPISTEQALQLGLLKMENDGRIVPAGPGILEVKMVNGKPVIAHDGNEIVGLNGEPIESANFPGMIFKSEPVPGLPPNSVKVDGPYEDDEDDEEDDEDDAEGSDKESEPVEARESAPEPAEPKTSHDLIQLPKSSRQLRQQIGLALQNGTGVQVLNPRNPFAEIVSRNQHVRGQLNFFRNEETAIPLMAGMLATISEQPFPNAVPAQWKRWAVSYLRDNLGIRIKANDVGVAGDVTAGGASVATGVGQALFMLANPYGVSIRVGNNVTMTQPRMVVEYPVRNNTKALRSETGVRPALPVNRVPVVFDAVSPWRIGAAITRTLDLFSLLNQWDFAMTEIMSGIMRDVDLCAFVADGTSQYNGHVGLNHVILTTEPVPTNMLNVVSAGANFTNINSNHLSEVIGRVESSPEGLMAPGFKGWVMNAQVYQRLKSQTAVPINALNLPVSPVVLVNNPAAGEMVTGTGRFLHGYPVEIFDGMPDSTDPGTGEYKVIALFGAFSRALGVGQYPAGTQFLLNPYSRMDEDIIELNARFHIAISTFNTGSATRFSPVAALILEG